MKLSKSAIIALTALSLSAVSAHAENDDFGHKSKGWGNKHEPNQQSTQRMEHRMQSKGSEKMQWEEKQNKRQKYRKHADKQYGYEKPKNPYNNGIHSPNFQWRHGDRLPVEYRGNRGARYAVDNWHDHPGLYAPPVDTRWAYIDGRYILANIATGIIYNVIYGN